jgi:transcriptional regulator with XRE-family HTH domain
VRKEIAYPNSAIRSLAKMQAADPGREWRGLTVRALAHMSGISAGHLSDIESGRRTPSADARKEPAHAIELEPDDLEPANMD